jgi:hypothetical protein
VARSRAPLRGPRARDRLTRLPGRYSLFTGGAGTALFAAACLEADARYPGARAPLGSAALRSPRWTNASSATRSSSSASGATCSRPGGLPLPGVEHRDLARALTRQAYRAGASYVNVLYRDGTRAGDDRARPDEALTYAPEWQKSSRTSTGQRAHRDDGDPEPELLADLDGERVGRAVPQELVQIQMQLMARAAVNWCGIGAPNEGWAQQVFGEPDVERLWEKIAFCMRLDEPDPGRRLAGAPRAARGAHAA